MEYSIDEHKRGRQGPKHTQGEKKKGTKALVHQEKYTPKPAKDDKGHWLPGVSGNPEGRPRGALAWPGVIREALEVSGEDGKTVRQQIVDVLVESALAGNTKAAELLQEREEGKAIIPLLTESLAEVVVIG